MKKLTVVLQDEVYTAVKVEAARRSRLLKDIVAQALVEWLEVQEDLELTPLIAEARAEYEQEGGIPADEFFRQLKEERRRKSA